MKDHLARLVPAIKRELAEAHAYHQYERATEIQRNLTRRIEAQHAQVVQKKIELGALNQLFQKYLAETRQVDSEHQELLRNLGGMILNAVEERHQTGKLPKATPAARELPASPSSEDSEEIPT